MIEEPYQQHRERNDHGSRHEKHERPVGHLPRRYRGEQPPGGAASRGRKSDQLLAHGTETCDHLHRKQAQQHAAEREPGEPYALEWTAVVRLSERGLARLTQEDDSEELHHDITGQRGAQRDQPRAHRDQHVDEAVRDLVGEQERLQQQPLRDESVERRQPGDGERAHEREPGDPRHAMNQPAQAPEVTLPRGVQHRAGAEKQQALHEGVVQAVIQRRNESQRRGQPHSGAEEHDRQAEPGECEPNVLDG